MRKVLKGTRESVDVRIYYDANKSPEKDDMRHGKGVCIPAAIALEVANAIIEAYEQEF